MNQKSHTFEENMQRLEQIVRAMERGDVPLEESLKLFREGTALVEACGKLLDDAVLQVKKIATAADGSPVEEVFEYEA
ncbi:MAG: exodeoxyribonuclease VII small subunit [Oscillospiraceae bacterium]|nr:exodeoxyribonuclease VII small subunit [Oscillospiraceae bacterium]